MDKRTLNEIIIALGLMSIGVLVFVLSSSQPAPEQVLVSLDEEFSLEYQESATLQDLTITFLGVGVDSRCPSDATCSRAGDVPVALRIEQGSNLLGDLTLNKEPGATASIELGEYTIEIVQVDPYPTTKRQLFPREYRINLIIR